jgi:hypothetical protein
MINARYPALGGGVANSPCVRRISSFGLQLDGVR